VLLICALLVGAPSPAVPDVRQALAVLHAWDARRAAAWAAGDEGAVRALYVPRSRAAATDTALLRAYAARGLVVTRIDVQVFGARVLAGGPGHLQLAVLDRVAGGEVRSGDRTAPLAPTEPVRRVVVLRRDTGAWRVVSLSAPDRSAPGPRG
jgi:hypothetical protein